MLSSKSEKSQSSDRSQTPEKNIYTTPFTYSTHRTISNTTESSIITPKTARIRKTVKFSE